MTLLRCPGRRLLAAGTIGLLLITVLPAHLPAQEPHTDGQVVEVPPAEADRPGSPEGQSGEPIPAQADSTSDTKELLQRLDDVLQSAASTRSLVDGQAAGDAKPQGDALPAATMLRLVPEDLHLGKIYRSAQHVRYVALRLWLVNTSDSSVTVETESIRLKTRGGDLSPNQVPEQRGLPHVPFGDQLLPLEKLSSTGPITVPAHGATRVPLAFFELPGTTDIPGMTLRVPVGDELAELDLNDYSRGLMRLSVERLGPGNLLGLVMIGGELTPVGAGELADALQQLTADQVTRVVIAWSETASPPPSELMTWLIQSAVRRSTAGMGDRQHPVLSPDLVELHLATVPEGTSVPNAAGSRRRVHDTLGEAVAAALDGAYDAVPLSVLVREIEQGHPLTRPAAVAAGERLPDDDLLLRLIDDADPAIAPAAVRALRGHGSPEVIAKLVALAKNGSEPLRAAAVESLAASRYGAAHEALRELLDASVDGTPVISPALLIPVLADYPRPLWSDALYRLAMHGDPAIRADALEALAQLGHPRLIDAFRSALDAEDDELRRRTFALAARQDDGPTQQLVLDVTLRHLETEPPTREMQLLLARTNEARAVPLLLTHIEAGGPQRWELVRLLVEIGGLEIREPLEAIYPKLNREMQREVLPTLADLQSSKFYEFAASALRSNDSALASVAAQQLQADGGHEAVELLANVLFESDQPAILSYVANGLAGIGTLEARQALRKADLVAGPRRDAAQRAWWNLQRQSAGWESFLAGVAAKRREDWQDAVNRFTEAIEVDPQFVDAWASRASARMQLNDYVGARTDYERTLELDPYEAAAVTCLGILRVFEGDVEEGLTFVAQRDDAFHQNEWFAYNTACLYAVASERIEKTDPPRAEQLRLDAVQELKRSITLGMTDPAAIAWIRRDPDLKSLHGRDDYETVAAGAEAKYGTDEGTGEESDNESRTP